MKTFIWDIFTIPDDKRQTVFYFTQNYCFLLECIHLYLTALSLTPFHSYNTTLEKDSWAKAVWQMSVGPKSKMLFLCIFCMAVGRHMLIG